MFASARLVLLSSLLLLPKTLAAADNPVTPQAGGSYSGIGVGSISAEVIKKYAPKPLPQALSQTIQREENIGSGGSGFRLTPDGKRLFFNWEVTGVSQIWRLDGPNTFPVQVTGGEEPTSVMALTRDGKFIVVRRDSAGEENPGLYLQSVDGGPLVTIKHEKGVQALFAYASRDGHTLYYTANDQAPDTRTVYAYDLKTRSSREVWSAPGLWDGVHESRDMKFLLLGKMKGNSVTEYSVLELATKSARPLLGQDGFSYQVQFGKSSDEFTVLTDRFGEFYRGYLYRNGKFEPATPEARFDVEYFDLNFAGTRYLYSFNKDGREEAHLVDSVTHKEIPLPKFPERGEVTLTNETASGRFTGFSIAGELKPPVRYVYDWNSKSLVQWTKPSVPELDISGYVESSLESYSARDGTRIPMLVYRSEKCRTELCPVVVDFHGGPEGQSHPRFSPAIQRFVREGLVVVYPNVRGSTGYGKSWLHADDGPKRLDVITDIEDCSLWIKKNWAKKGVVPKIGVKGASYGGYSAQIAMSMFAGAYDAGVASVGPSNLVSFLRNTAPYRRSLRVAEYGDPDKDAEALRKLSPITYVERIKGPLLIIQGVNDPRVPAGEAVQIQELLEKRGVNSELILFPNAGHGTVSRNDTVISLGHTFQFFRKYLLGKGG